MNNYSPFSIDHTTLEETVNHITSAFPYMSNIDNLHLYPERTFPWHWHNEIELFCMQDGEIDYHLPSGCYTFRKGEGAFINSNVLHMTCCSASTSCLQKEHLFTPEFIGGEKGSILMQKYVKPIVENSGLEFFHLYPHIPAHKEILDLLSQCHQLYIEQRDGYELEIHAKMTLIWKQLYQLTKDVHAEKATITSIKVKQMMLYIANHYGEKITLKEIADAGFISIRECNRCFHETLSVTPFSYVRDYRLCKAQNLLIHTTLSITEIAATCGFSTGSYFGKLFYQKYHCSPRTYRKARSTQ